MPPPTFVGVLQFNWILPALVIAVSPTGALTIGFFLLINNKAARMIKMMATIPIPAYNAVLSLLDAAAAGLGIALTVAETDPFPLAFLATP